MFCHIISPSSSLSAPGSNRNQLLLAHALVLEADLRLFSMLEEDKDLKVIFLMVLTAWRQSHRQKYDQTNRLDQKAIMVERCGIVSISPTHVLR